MGTCVCVCARARAVSICLQEMKYHDATTLAQEAGLDYATLDEWNSELLSFDRHQVAATLTSAMLQRKAISSPSLQRLLAALSAADASSDHSCLHVIFSTLRLLPRNSHLHAVFLQENTHELVQGRTGIIPSCLTYEDSGQA